MASGKRKRFPKCSHYGFGKFCHRCNFADELEALLKAGKAYSVTTKGKAKQLSGEEVRSEITRLRSNEKRNRGYNE